MENNEIIFRYDVLTPDETRMYGPKTFICPIHAIYAAKEWIKQFKDQGYYYSTKHGNIRYEYILDYCWLIMLDFKNGKYIKNTKLVTLDEDGICLFTLGREYILKSMK